MNETLSGSTLATDAIARRLAGIAALAGDALMCFRTPECRRVAKPDGSPVTEADLAAEAVILKRLAAEFPQWPAVSEERGVGEGLERGGDFFLVDPLDGTRAFIGGGPDFCVLIALIAGGAPVASAMHAPATGESWWGGASAFKSDTRDFGAIRTLEPLPKRDGGLIAIVSSVHAGTESRVLCTKFDIAEVRSENSALKFARLAEGEADIYPRIGRTMQWDIATGDGLLRALGGGVVDLEGRPLVYGAGAEGWANPDFIAHRRLPG